MNPSWIKKLRPEKKRAAAVFFFGLVLIILFWLMRGEIERLFLKEISFRNYDQTAYVRSKTLSLNYQNSKPVFIKNQEELSLNCKSAASIYVNRKGEDKILWQKNPSEKLPIASLTKLMTGWVSLKEYEPNDVIIFSKEAARKEGEPNFFKEGESFYVKDLIYSIFVESSNRAAYALAEKENINGFVEKMNKEAEKLGMESTVFYNPTGLDPDEEGETLNFSSAEDLVRLVKEILTHPSLAIQASQTKSRDLYQVNGGFHHTMNSTNELLEKTNNIVLAKTGRTPEAKECLLIVQEKPNGFLINVVLGAEDNFSAMEKLINWTENNFKW